MDANSFAREYVAALRGGRHDFCYQALRQEGDRAVWLHKYHRVKRLKVLNLVDEQGATLLRKASAAYVLGNVCPSRRPAKMTSYSEYKNTKLIDSLGVLFDVIADHSQHLI